MAALLWGLAIPLQPWLSSAAPLPMQIIALGALVLAGMAIYFGLVHVTGAQRLGALLGRLRRPR
jgi:putative peptidoglycan lipid II flippase